MTWAFLTPLQESGASSTCLAVGLVPAATCSARKNAPGPLNRAVAQQRTTRRPAIASLALLGNETNGPLGYIRDTNCADSTLDAPIISRVERILTPSHSDAPSRSSVGSFIAQVHNLATKKFKSLRRQGLSKEVSVVIMRVNEGHQDLLRLHHVSDEEVPTLHVLGAIMMLRVIR